LLRPFGTALRKVNVRRDGCATAPVPTTVITVDPVLVTERLCARPWTLDEADLAAAYDVYSRPEVAQWIGAPMEPAEIKIRIERWAQPTDDPTYGVWAVEELARPGRPIGSVLLRPLPPDEEDVEVGWHLHPAVWGRGYATEIGRAAAKRAFETGIDEVFAIVRPGNERSSRVARRLGMSYVGRTDKYWGLHAELFRLRPADLIDPTELSRYATR
jgi:RimJ/RimL family protein N-acetyltransferase